MSFGKTIRIYLPDGSPTGLKHVELVNWTGQAMICPRTRVADLANWADQSHRPGVYLLFGDDPASVDGQLAYIGEAENVFKRLKYHTKTKDFWDSAVFFTSKDENLTKAHVKYLESHMIRLADEAGRAKLTNEQKPEPPRLPRAYQDAMDEYLASARMVLTALGHPLLQPVAESSIKAVGEDDDEDWPTLFFEYAKRAVNAVGSPNDEGFVIHAGSRAATSVTKSMQPTYRLQREELIANGTLRLVDDQLVMQRDTLFSSSSAAAAVLIGYNISGPKSWKDSTGRTLKEIEEAWFHESENEDD